MAIPAPPPPHTGGPRRTQHPKNLSLSRQLLFPDLSPDLPLPRLVPGPSDSKDLLLVNERIYHLIALAFRAYILSWLPRITKDRSILPEIHQSILVPLLQPLFEEISQHPSKLVEPILVDLPTLLQLHVETYHSARDAVALDLGVQRWVGVGLKRQRRLEVDDAYHARLPLESVRKSSKGATTSQSTEDTSMGTGAGSGASSGAGPGYDDPGNDLDVEKRGTVDRYEVSPEWLTCLSDSWLKIRLPHPDYTSSSERVMVRELIGRTILGGIARRLQAPWFWYGLGLRLLGPSPSPSSTFSTLRSPTSTSTSVSPKNRSNRSNRSNTSTWTWIVDIGIAALSYALRLWSGIITGWTMVWTVFEVWATAPSTGQRYRGCTLPWISLVRSILVGSGPQDVQHSSWTLRTLVSALELSLDFCSPFIDRIVPHLLQDRLCSPQMAIRLTDLVEKIIFPLDGYPAPTPDDPSPEETLILRRTLEQRLSEVLPRYALGIIPPPSRFLDPISDEGCNAHLVGMVYTAVVATLIPELVASGSHSNFVSRNGS